MDLDNEELFRDPEPATQNTIVDRMDYMDISGFEEEDEETINLTSVPSNPIPNDQMRPLRQTNTERVNYTLIPETGAFITATCPQTGRNIYFPKISEGRLKKKTNLLVRDLTTSKGGTKGLLAKPLWQMLEDIKKKNLERTQEIQR